MNAFKKINDGLIFAADLKTLDENLYIIKLIEPRISAVKLPNHVLFRHSEKEIRKFCKKSKKPVFFDTKIADVPHTNKRIVKWARNAGAAAVSVHGFIGPDGVLECLDAAGDMAVVIQTELTSPGSEVFNDAISMKIVQLTYSLGARAFQAPGNRPDRIRMVREVVGKNSLVVCCGVGTQGGVPASAFSAGASAVIVGRRIYESDRPEEEVIRLLNE